jgi:hypothetical protein
VGTTTTSACHVSGRFLAVGLSGKHNGQRGFCAELGPRLEERFSYPTTVRVGDDQELLAFLEGQRRDKDGLGR